MAKIIQVTPELLESTAGKIEGLAGDYKTQYDQLYSETNAMASTWNGKDNVAFVDQIAGFKDDFEKMPISLEKAPRAIVTRRTTLLPRLASLLIKGE